MLRVCLQESLPHGMKVSRFVGYQSHTTGLYSTQGLGLRGGTCAPTSVCNDVVPPGNYGSHPKKHPFVGGPRSGFPGHESRRELRSLPARRGWASYVVIVIREKPELWIHVQL